MTIDDDKSIYVGGLPYNYTEDSLRKVFDIYGAVVAVKINNDQDIGGKCYGFVTFTNPRSAIVAIEDMDGKKIGGRIVRVNEVRSRMGRSNFNRENVRHDPERHMDWSRGRGRGRERDHDHGRGHGHERDHYHGRNSDRSRDEDAEYERARDHDDRIREPSLSRDRERDLNEQQRNKIHDRDWGKERDLELNREREVHRMNDNDLTLKSRSGSHLVDRRSRELSLTSSDDYHGQVIEQVEVSNQKHGLIQKEISHIEEKVKEKHQLILELKKKSQKLEDALASAKKLSAKRQRHLTTLQRSFMQVKDYSEKLKSSELELQTLIDTTMIESDDGEDVEAGNVDLHAYVNA